MADAKFINKYANDQAYAADTHKANGSEVSLIADTGKVVYDGVNVEKPAGVVPDVGDALWVDSTGGKHFFALDTVKHDLLTAKGMTFVGAVAMRKGSKVWILHKEENSSVRFTSCWAWEITGIVYNSENTIQFQQRKRTSASGVTPETFANFDVGSPLVFTPTDIDDAVSKINAHLLSYQGGIEAGGTWNYDWHCCKIDGRIWVVSDFTNPSYRQYEVQVVKNGSGEIKSSSNMFSLLGFEKNVYQKKSVDGVKDGSCLWNVSRAKQYMDSNGNIGTPTDSLSSTGVYSEQNWNNLPSDSILKTTYKTYDTYLNAKMLAFPSSYGVVSVYFCTAKGVCEKAETLTYTKKDGVTTDYMFSAIHYAKTRLALDGQSVEGMNAGDWYMPGVDECLEIFGPMLTNGQDKINKCLVQSNSIARALSLSRWVPARHGSSYAWLLYGYGYMFNTNFYNTYGACAVALLEF